MPTCSRGDVVLVRYPFSDLSSLKVRPAVVVNAHHVKTVGHLTPSDLARLSTTLRDWLSL